MSDLLRAAWEFLKLLPKLAKAVYGFDVPIVSLISWFSTISAIIGFARKKKFR